MVSITNTTRRIAVVLLPHDSYCRALGRCVCTRRKDGLLLASTLTLPAGETVPGLAQAVLEVPALKRLLHAGDVRVELCTRAESGPKRGAR